MATYLQHIETVWKRSYYMTDLNFSKAQRLNYNISVANAKLSFTSYHELVLDLLNLSIELVCASENVFYVLGG